MAGAPATRRYVADPDLPVGWKAVYDLAQQRIYYMTPSGATTWDHPVRAADQSHVGGSDAVVSSGEHHHHSQHQQQPDGGDDDRHRRLSRSRSRSEGNNRRQRGGSKGRHRSRSRSASPPPPQGRQQQPPPNPSLPNAQPPSRSNHNYAFDKKVLSAELYKVLTSSNPLVPTALVHPSFPNATQEERLAFGRLEFVGKSVLSMFCVMGLVKRHPDASEGDIAFSKTGLLGPDALLAWSRRSGLESCDAIRRDRLNGEESNNMVDVVRAIVGATYLELGFKTTHELLANDILDDGQGIMSDAGVDASLAVRETMWLGGEPVNLADIAKDRNSKGLLLQLLQKISPTAVVKYELVDDSGPAHCKHFEVVCKINSQLVGRGAGTSKREAETQAAIDCVKAWMASGLGLGFLTDVDLSQSKVGRSQVPLSANSVMHHASRWQVGAIPSAATARATLSAPPARALTNGGEDDAAPIEQLPQLVDPPPR